MPPTVSRRHFVTLAGVLAGVMPLLSGCGFKLRGTPTLPFTSLYLDAPPAAALTREVARQLSAISNLRLLLPGAAMPPGSPDAPAQAEVTLHLKPEQYERVVLSKTTAGQVRELELRLHAHWSLTGRDGRIWLPDTQISQHRDMSYSESLVLAKDEEEAVLLRHMRTDIAQQLLRRLTLAQPTAPHPNH